MDLDSDVGRERILLAAQPGVGKTYALLALADYIKLRNEKSKIYIVDTDRGMSKVHKAHWPQVNVDKYFLIKSWGDVNAFMDELRDKVTSQDWLLIDMLGRFWEMAQALETSAVHGVSTGQAMLEARKKMVEAQKLNAPGSLGQPDWTVIKRFHNAEFIDELSTGWDCNIVATTELVKLDTERDDSLLVEIFAPFGFRPGGEKYNVHRFDTVMLLFSEGDNRYYSLAKDRGRPLLKHVKFGESLWDTYAGRLDKAGMEFASA